MSGSSGQGGIAVNGKTGDIYVSNPANGKVYVFGDDAPATIAGAATNVTKTSATLHGTIYPRAAPVTECKFEYGRRKGMKLIPGEPTRPPCMDA